MEERAIVVRDMKICRFCLDESEPLTKIFDKEAKLNVPLPLQIMACVAIEVFASDGMPQYICNSCRNQTMQAYTFKTNCKRADDAIKLYVATGKLVKPIMSASLIQIASPKRRFAGDVQANPPKRQKYLGNPDVLSINFSNSGLELTRRSNEESEPEHILGLNNEDTHFANLGESEDEETEVHTIAMQEEMQSEGEDDTINPILKVPQVATDVFPCDQCDRSFPLQQLLDIHIKNHERDRSFSCEECGRKFFTKYDLGKHLQTHTDSKPYTCVVCRKSFSRESLLHRHEKIHIDVPKYLCSCCDRTFLTREDLDAHSEKHKKKRPFACRICNKSFVFKQGLERHELAHADHKPHKCNYCEASFTSPIKLTRHITSHAGLRPYPCKLCGRTFLLSHHLTRHMRSHYAAQSSMSLPLGQHKCDVCSMSFRRKDSLINHSAIHSMVNLRCVICNTAFENAKMVKEHIATHLSGLPYPCDRCDYSFETQDQLEEHELKHVEMEYEDQIEKEVSLEAKGQNEEENDLDEEYNSAEDEEQGIAEFTITNPDNPEVVRRSKRDSKIKNYAQFLKDEIGSEPEEEAVHEEIPEEFPDEPLKPIVRSEGTKMYSRRSLPIKQKLVTPLKPPEALMAPLEQITQAPAPTIETLGLSKQAVSALADKKYIDMKIGDKTVRVQKLIMTKAEIESMAKQGKIEMKGDTILLKNHRTMSQLSNLEKTEKLVPVASPINLNSIISDPKIAQILPTAKPVTIRKTYVKRFSTGDSAENGNVNTHSEPEIQTVTMSEVEINSQKV